MDNSYRIATLTGDWESIIRMESDDRNPVAIPHRPWHQVYFLNNGATLMTPEQNDAMYEEVYKPIADYEKEVAEGNKKALAWVKEQKSPSFYRNLKKWLNEFTEGCDHIGNYRCKWIKINLFV